MIKYGTTDAELLLLGLVAEMPRHGYELEQVIEERGMRQWTQIGFSSIYFVLGKLQKAGFVAAKKPAGPKSKKTFAITSAGREALAVQTLDALRNVRPTYSSVLIGMIHWRTVDHGSALGALKARKAAVTGESERLERIRFQRQPLPDFVEALFDFSAGQLEAEKEWITSTLDYMQTKPINGD
ncbi:MAG: PadR family transcriptional regulator [Parvularculaceae bacterium]